MPKVIANVISPGLFTTIQDSGRFGHLALGIPTGGAMDLQSMHIANDLVGNYANSPTLEFTLIGPTIEFEGAARIAITGAEFEVLINGELHPMYQTIQVENGDKLEIKEAKNGCRGYLAIGGHWNEEKWLDSYSTPSIYMKSFGLETQIEAGRKIEVDTPYKKLEPKELTHKKLIFSECTLIRTVTSPDFEVFNIAEIEEFYETIFTISNDSNRMGYRLNEELKSYQKKKEQLSSGIIPGTIQISNSGQPMILTADAQTTGGYPRIANVISEDLSWVGQLKPGNKVKFVLSGLESA